MKNSINPFAIAILALLAFAVIGFSGCVEPLPPTGIVKEKGNRLLGIEVSQESSKDYSNAFSIARNVGMQVVELSQAWNAIETSPEQFDGKILGIANNYFPANNTKVALTISVIDTVADTLPQDLKGKAFNSPEVIERFNKLVDFVFSQTSSLEIVSLSIGNEVDVFFGSDAGKWSEFQFFFERVRDYVKLKNPELKVGVKATFNGLTKNNVAELQFLNRFSDVVLVTYYPLNDDFTVREPLVVESDFNKVVLLYAGKIVFFLETGFPSSTALNSSESKQAEFVRQVFKAWDLHSEQVKLVNFNWLHDRSSEEVSSFLQYYGISSNNFKEYLASLGLRTFEGKDKQAFKTLQAETKARGW